ncbi:MAG TPA: RidA family protein [Caulobacteraceae bacterium]|jgi:enamine deaminase RidA (YjgF/YER057c/UK114 family)|nr:RidA family protein [Caulobacteraceae bacterium]
MLTKYITRPAMKPLLDPYGLSEAVRRGGTLYIAGQTGMGEDHRIVKGGLKAQALQAFRNIRAVLELAGGDPENLVSLTWYLVEGPEPRAFMEDAVDVLAAKEEAMPGIRPGTTAVRVKALLTPEILVEIQAVAEL